jgi:hypothetical protein
MGMVRVSGFWFLKPKIDVTRFQVSGFEVQGSKPETYFHSFSDEN